MLDDQDMESHFEARAAHDDAHPQATFEIPIGILYEDPERVDRAFLPRPSEQEVIITLRLRVVSSESDQSRSNP